MTKSITASIWTPRRVRAAYRSDGHFFDTDTMHFFGDSIESFGCIEFHGLHYLYRRKNAKVSVFGKRQTAGRAFFGVWQIVRTAQVGCVVDLDCVDDETKNAIYLAMYGKGGAK